MNDLAFEIAEYERDRETTLKQLRVARIGFPGHAAYVDKYTAQLARIDARLAELRALEASACDCDGVGMCAAHVAEMLDATGIDPTKHEPDGWE